MTPLAEILRRRIALDGPITVAEYMAECLLHPRHGYYTTRDPFGAAGDFTTAPEISQIFGEMIGLWLAQAWIDRGRPAPFCLAEPGPGRGTLMADIWRVAGAVPGFREAARLVLVEASPRLRGIQRDALPGAAPRWIDRLEDLPELPLFLVANEFLDALPIRQFVRDPAGWRERQIGADADGLVLGLGPAAPLALLDHRLDDTAPGEMVETCPALPALAGAVAARISRHGGAALFIDYGGWHSRGDTLQAVRRHRSVPVLETPGEADLTAHVDFEALARAAPGCAVSPMVPQGVFLERLGITERARALSRGLADAPRESLIAAHRRLTHPDEMGTVFKTMGLASTASPPLPGLTQWP
ncbi:class I SAM-dependent methyltransferase [Mangrovicoccus algicola]|uniref:SAM-dependent methyltransferase n=1 Tax=Mangrovicoccus algicola TaxID=2771008 RepID=A0A8J6ZAY7_9RHOB|nr:SAM-dependent methyltransferase [Mangrovicoccus algicola]MBE3639431.1 SAM-dependent methyltransferase [Mangrovicoccus algicola]